MIEFTKRARRTISVKSGHFAIIYGAEYYSYLVVYRNMFLKQKSAPRTTR